MMLKEKKEENRQQEKKDEKRRNTHVSMKAINRENYDHLEIYYLKYRYMIRVLEFLQLYST